MAEPSVFYFFFFLPFEYVICLIRFGWLVFMCLQRVDMNK